MVLRTRVFIDPEYRFGSDFKNRISIRIQEEAEMSQRKYYEAYDDRYRQIHGENLEWFHSAYSRMSLLLSKRHSSKIFRVSICLLPICRSA